jgi:hypothetical protein
MKHAKHFSDFYISIIANIDMQNSAYMVRRKISSESNKLNKRKTERKFRE